MRAGEGQNSMTGLKSVLDLASCYNLFQKFVRGDRMYHLFVGDYIRPRQGDRILDIGCGPATLLNYLPQVSYVGFDMSPNYINHAQRHFGSRGEFHVGVVQDASTDLNLQAASFDIIVALGVLHHLNDQEALKLMKTSRLLLKPGGRLVTIDGCYVPKQSRAAKFLLDRDRGEYVRTENEYGDLASICFPATEIAIRHDLLRIPYTHCLMNCRKQ